MRYFFGEGNKYRIVNMNGKWLLVLFVATGVISGVVWVFSNKEIIKPTVVSFNIKKEEKIGADIEKLVATASGEWVVYVYKLDSGESYGINENKIMPAASIMKIPALAAVATRSGETWILEEADRRTGSGPLQFLRAGTAISVERVMNELGKKSDNTAWVMINRRLGYAEIEKYVPSNTNYRELTTTASDVGLMLRKIYENQELWPYLEDSIYEDRISLGLLEGVRLVHKVGTDTGIWADAGIIFGDKPFILVILNKEVEREEAGKLVPEITKLAWNDANKDEKSD
ncbi:MAG: beta-lactamase [Microgenomates group bacterium Gr01-1014_16]|nr:MAG: beta-lactamase [Microgenomates group bacterium Gr01-1014_16]